MLCFCFRLFSTLRTRPKTPPNTRGPESYLIIRVEPRYLTSRGPRRRATMVKDATIRCPATDVLLDFIFLIFFIFFSFFHFSLKRSSYLIRKQRIELLRRPHTRKTQETNTHTHKHTHGATKKQKTNARTENPVRAHSRRAANGLAIGGSVEFERI